MYAASVIRSMLDDSAVPGVIPRELLTTDRILQRWAVSSGTGLPADDVDAPPVSRPPPLDDHTAIEVDILICKSPPKTRKLIKSWYRSEVPSYLIAESLGMSRRSLYKAHHVALGFMKWKFEGSGHRDLIRLVQVHIA